MTIAISASYNSDTDSPGVDLTLSGLSGHEKVTVERVNNSGDYETVPVRGLNQTTVTGSTMLVTDFEAPIGLSVKYRATGSQFDPKITFGGSGVASGGSTVANPNYPAGSVTDDLHIMSVVMKPYTATLATPSGWTLLTTKTSGTTASGPDTGSVVMYAFYRIGAFSGTVPLAPTGSNAITAAIDSFQKDVANAWELTTVSGSEETSVTGHNSTSTATLAPQANDFLFATAGFRTDRDVTFNTGSISLANSSLETPTWTHRDENASGDDVGLELAYVKVSSSMGAGLASYVATNPAAGLHGVSIFVRISTTGSSSETVETASLTLPYNETGQAWIKSVFTPLASRQVYVSEWPATEYDTKILGNFKVLGRVRPVIITDAWGGRSGSMTLLSGREDLTPFKDLKDLLTTGGALLFQTTGNVVDHQPDMYFEVEGYSVKRVDRLVGSPEALYEHEIKFIEVDQPDTSDAGLSLRTYQDVLDTYTTYQDILDQHNTYLELLLAG